MFLFRNATFAFALGLAVAMFSAPAVAQHMHGEDQHCRIGDHGCNHGVYHEIYRLLELISGRTCCNDSEGRPTKDVIDATPEQAKQGFRFQAYVDGQWCPAKAESLLRFSESEKGRLKLFKNSELILSFFESSHVFAPKSARDVFGKAICPTIYCLWPRLPPT